MRIKARGHHAFRCYTAHLPEGGTLTVDAGTTVERVLDQLKVPAVQRVTLVTFVNGRPARLDQVLQERDDLVFFSPVECG
jgi:sulfur carrier protein ThiS